MLFMEPKFTVFENKYGGRFYSDYTPIELTDELIIIEHTETEEQARKIVKETQELNQMISILNNIP